MQVRVALGYHVQSLLSSYTAAQIDHVDLKLLRLVSGSYQATGAVTTVAASALGGAVNLSNLRYGSQYRIEADAYADAAETQLISNAAASVTDFTTPALTASTSGDSVDDTPVGLVSLNLTLSDQTYAGTGSFGVALSTRVQKKASSVTVKLLEGTSTLVTQSLPPASVNAGQTFALNNLRMGTTYTLEADAYNSAGALLSTPARSQVSFTTPAVASGTVDTQVSATPYSVPCQ